MSRPGFGACVVLAAALLSSAAQAQDISGVKSGARIRIHGPALEARGLVGRLVEATEQSVSVVTKEGKPPVVVKRRDIDWVDLSIHRSRKAKGAAVGALVGALAGGIIGAVTYSEPEPGKWDFVGREGSAAGGAILGLAGGALLGLAVAPGEKWQRLPEKPAMASAGSWHPSGRHGVWFAVSIQFWRGARVAAAVHAVQ